MVFGWLEQTVQAVVAAAAPGALAAFGNSNIKSFANTNRSSSVNYYNNNNNCATSSTLAVVGSALATVASAVVLVQCTTSANPLGKSWTFWKQMGRQERGLTCSDNVNSGIDEYNALHHRDTDASTRAKQYKKLVNAYYDLATVFYEWGWGDSFHFSFQFPWERFMTSIRRHEYALAAQLENCFGPTKHILDVGCGIGGPARTIGAFLQCRITGLTLNPYQVQRGNELNAADSYSQVTCVQGDFMELSTSLIGTAAAAPLLFDGAYAIEATCHAPDRTACYRQIYNVLKPGAVFACYEWCMTDLYNANNPEHARLKKDIELGNGLPDICTTRDCLAALQEAGFEVVTESDLAVTTMGDSIQPWMTPLQPSWNLLSQRFQFNPVGAVCTNAVIRLLELVRLAPAGTVKTQQTLQAGGFALRDAGAEGIFTVMYLLVGRKPMVGAA